MSKRFMVNLLVRECGVGMPEAPIRLRACPPSICTLARLARLVQMPGKRALAMRESALSVAHTQIAGNVRQRTERQATNAYAANLPAPTFLV
ncbi:MAG: hypothetical protein Q7J36_00705 [Thiobacillus sp.]|nr:hypothetical protein [Thiobacillus sp.]